MTQEEAIKKALYKATTDSIFKSNLIENTLGTLSKEFPTVNFSNEIHLDIELDETDLELVTGGIDFGDPTDGDGKGEDCTKGIGYGHSGNGGMNGQGQNNGQGWGVKSK